MVSAIGLIDTHAHIYEDRLFEEIDKHMISAQENNVTGVYMPNVDLSTIEKMLTIERNYPQTRSMMGLHPCGVKVDYTQVLETMYQWFAKHNFIAIGETGLDLYWDKTYFEEQKKSFDIQLSWAKEFSLPIVIHSRSSIDECIEMVHKHQNGSLTGVFHCFSGDAMQALKIKDLGFYIGIGGVITYKNSELPSVLIENGLDNVVLETDSPYLPPVPHRGKTNEPAYLLHVAQKIAEIFSIQLEGVASMTSQNAKSLFKN